MYTELITLLKESKATRDKEHARNTLRRVGEYLMQAPHNSEFRNQLIADEEYLFPVEHEQRYHTYGLDYTFSTKGYLNQVIDILGVTNGEEYVNALYEALNDMHSAISSGRDATAEQQVFERVLDDWRNLVV